MTTEQHAQLTSLLQNTKAVQWSQLLGGRRTLPCALYCCIAIMMEKTTEHLQEWRITHKAAPNRRGIRKYLWSVTLTRTTMSRAGPSLQHGKNLLRSAAIWAWSWLSSWWHALCSSCGVSCVSSPNLTPNTSPCSLLACVPVYAILW